MLFVGFVAEAQEVAGVREVVPEGDRALLLDGAKQSDKASTKVPYGIEPGRKTFSPIYHLTSSLLWLWEAGLAADVASPGGYATLNTDYYKALVAEYGYIGGVIYGIDRTMRNTKIGRHTQPKNAIGLVEDDVWRYKINPKNNEEQR